MLAAALLAILLIAFPGEVRSDAFPGLDKACQLWAYVGGRVQGAKSWAYKCPYGCNGTQQSPINIPLGKLYKPPLYYLEPLSVEMPRITGSTPTYVLKNSGHSMSLEVRKKVAITGVGLPGKYYVKYIHWHWGNTFSGGSEHLISGRAYPMEGHVVTYRSDFQSIYAALGHAEGVAVFAILYDESYAIDNPVYEWISKLSKLKSATDNVTLDPFDITYLLPTLKYPMYRYNGSLTTPPCTEGIIWTIFAHPVPLSPRQMALVRTSLNYTDENPLESGPMVNNFRPTQPLNGRHVYVIDPHTHPAFAGAYGNPNTHPHQNPIMRYDAVHVPVSHSSRPHSHSIPSTLVSLIALLTIIPFFRCWLMMFNKF